MQKYTGLIIVVIFAIVGIYYVFHKNTPPEIIPSKPQKLVNVFQGNLPCADCSGITETLTLTEDASGNPTTFNQKDLYQGKDVTNTTTGTWTIQHGASFDKTATVYVLTPSGETNNTMYFLKQGDNAVLMLDTSGNKIDSPFNQTLRRIE
jgi:copper homeostasis protein (lipoprotein)